MGVPITQGKLQTKIASMSIGDYIAARYTTSAMTANGTYSQIGTVDTTTVNPFSSTNLDGYVYLIKIAKGVLVPNVRNCTGVTYTALNADNRIYGKKITIDTQDFLIRVPKIEECLKMGSILDGMLDIANVAANFGVTASTTDYEIVQENFNLTQGVFQFGTLPAVAANAVASATATAARFVLTFAEDSKCTNLYY